MRYFLFISFISSVLFTNLAMADGKIIMIAASAPPGGADATVKTRLEGLGFEVEVHSHTESHPVDVEGAAVVFISESVLSGNVGGAYKDSPVPVIINEAWVLDDMNFAPGGEPFSKNADLSIIIKDPNHPIAGGLNGEVNVVTGNGQILACSDLQGDVQIVATLANGDATLAAYEVGAKIADGSKVPARRVFAFLHEAAVSLLTDDGWTLIENSVLWAVEEPRIAVDPGGSVPATWGMLKAKYR